LPHPTTDGIFTHKGKSLPLIKGYLAL